jgi:hypothetical protein
MKLFVSALLLVAASAAFAQSQPANQGAAVVTLAPGEAAQPSQATDATQKKAQAALQALIDTATQADCPLYMESARVSPNAAYLPVTAQNRQDAGLDLHFRNQSGKAIASASITARLSVKTDVYALDAHTLQLRFTLAGTQDFDKTLEQFQRIVLPKHVYLYGVARVTLEQVGFADGTVWSAPAGNNACRTSGSGSIDKIAK